VRSGNEDRYFGATSGARQRVVGDTDQGAVLESADREEVLPLFRQRPGPLVEISWVHREESEVALMFGERLDNRTTAA
jgi:hypothetical protein